MQGYYRATTLTAMRRALRHKRLRYVTIREATTAVGAGAANHPRRGDAIDYLRNNRRRVTLFRRVFCFFSGRRSITSARITNAVLYDHSHAAHIGDVFQWVL